MLFIYTFMINSETMWGAGLFELFRSIPDGVRYCGCGAFRNYVISSSSV